ncbi:hypothetical protein KR044_013387 [Drosophila immigrans]|nr:hypothetical protein KR044_013387 [Drosophila immigrans]
MANRLQRSSKLRFALITEDALQTLRPEQKDIGSMEIKDIYETINVTVNAIMESKIRSLKLDKLDELIEQKINDLQGKQNKLTKRKSSSSINTLSDFRIAGARCNSRSIFANSPKKLQQHKFQNKEPSKIGYACVKKQNNNNRKVATTKQKAAIQKSNKPNKKRALAKTGE